MLAHRTVLITGAARGIGRAIADAMYSHGARVVLSDLTAPDVTDKQRQLGVVLDVTDEDATKMVFDDLEGKGWLPDVIIPNAGILVLCDTVGLEKATFESVLQVNLTGAFLTAREAARRMPDSGRIIFTSSLFGTRGGSGNSAYSASKFGLNGIMQSLAAELGPREILVNSVAPGQIMTDMIRQLFALRIAEGQDDPETAMNAKIAMGRFGTAEELAGTYVWLASDLSSYITGQTIIVDGGQSVA